MNKTGLVGGIAVAIIFVIGIIGTLMCTERVPAGYIGIVYNMSGGVTGKTLQQGWHIVKPTEKVTNYSVAIEQAYLSKNEAEGSPNDDSFDIPTSDGKTINVDVEFSYHFDPDKVTDTFTKFKGQSGKTIEETFIKGKVKAWAGEVSSTYTVIDVFGDKRAELNTTMKDYIANKFSSYGIVIDTVNFTRIETDAETAAAIQKKVNAQQAQELANIEAKTAQINANKDKQVALIKAEKEKEVAQINADQMAITTTAEAKRYKQLSDTITPQLISKWEMEARKLHGWVTIQGANTVVTK